MGKLHTCLSFFSLEYFIHSYQSLDPNSGYSNSIKNSDLYGFFSLLSGIASPFTIIFSKSLRKRRQFSGFSIQIFIRVKYLVLRSNFSCYFYRDRQSCPLPLLKFYVNVTHNCIRMKDTLSMKERFSDTCNAIVTVGFQTRRNVVVC